MNKIKVEFRDEGVLSGVWAPSKAVEIKFVEFRAVYPSGMDAYSIVRTTVIGPKERRRFRNICCRARVVAQVARHLALIGRIGMTPRMKLSSDRRICDGITHETSPPAFQVLEMSGLRTSFERLMSIIYCKVVGTLHVTCRISESL